MIRLDGVSKYYNTDNNVVLGLRRVSLNLELGEFVAITGESGSGKSTLLNVISGLDKYDEGELYVNNEETSYFSVEELEQYRKQYIGFVFQNYNIIDSFTVLENVMAALMIQGYDPKNRKKRALELIDKVGLTSHKNHRASKLSGGQKQRAVIARALAKDAPIIVADEPTGNLDSKSGEMIMALLKEISNDKLVIVVTHNYDQVKPYVTRKIRLFDGEIAEDVTLIKHEKAASKPIVSKNLSLIDTIKMALLSIFRMPKKSILLFLTLIFSIIGIQSIYAFDKYAPDLIFSGLRDYNQLFPNNFEQRVIFTKKDKSAFTQTELDLFKDATGVLEVIHHDALFDTEFLYKKENDPFIRSGYGIVSSGQSRDILESGDLPKEGEIVVRNFGGDQKFEIGDTVEIYYNFYYRDQMLLNPDDTYESIRLTVSGILKGSYGSYGMIFHPSFFNQSTSNIINTNNNMAFLSINNTFGIEIDDERIYLGRNFDIRIDNNIPLGEIRLSNRYASHFYDELNLNETTIKQKSVSIIKEAHKFVGETAINVTISEIYTGDFGFSMHINIDTLKPLIEERPYQISVIVPDTFYARRLADTYGDNYNIIHPASYQGLDFEIGGLGFLTFLAFSLVGGFLYIILNLVVKSVIDSRRKDFVIFRSIGASKRDLKRMLLIEQILFASIGYLLAYTTLMILDLSIKGFFVLRYIDTGFHVFSYILFLSILLSIGRKFATKIFGRSVITTLKAE